MLHTVPERPTWFHEDAPHLGVMNGLSNAIARSERSRPGVIPDLRGAPTLLLGSDYAGFHRSARFEVISFIASNLELLQDWDRERCALRESILLDGRRMSFKSLNDRQRRLALSAFLAAANRIPGLLFTVAIDRRMETVFEERRKLTRGGVDSEEFDGWKISTSERALRVMHLASLLVRGLCEKGQDMLWVTDEDEIVANDDRLRTFVNVFASISGHYITKQMRHLRIATTKSDTGRRDLEDYVAICDLAAGCLQESLSTGGLDSLVKAPSLFLPRKQVHRSKLTDLLDWFSDNGQPLKRLLYVFDEDEASGRMRLTPIRAHGSNDPW